MVMDDKYIENPEQLKTEPDQEACWELLVNRGFLLYSEWSSTPYLLMNNEQWTIGSLLI